MKVNQLGLLGITSAIVAVLPISACAIAAQMPAASTNPPAIANTIANTVANTGAQTQTVSLFSGTFVAAEKPTTGTAQIVTEGGHRYLELDAAFSTSDQGPDLHVLLDPAPTPAASYDNQGSTINLGSLREYSGTQRYPIPDSIDLANYKSVVIWCRMANATFGYAPLHSVSNASVR